MRLVPDLEASENKMADLDNFFAKKDKRKKGGKGFSKANTEIIAKNLEEIQRKELAAQEKEISMMENNLEKITNPLRKMLCSDDSEEWNDYREKVKDYSVLKIESVRLVSTDNEEQVSESHDAKVPAAESQEQSSAADLLDVNIDPFDEDEDKSEDTSLASSRRETPSPNPPRHQENEEGDSAGFKTVGKASSYVPPHLRVSQPPKELNVTTTGKSRRSKKVAPDINSEVYFPCLGVQDTLGSSREPSPVPSISPNSELKGAWEKKLEM